MAKKGVSVQREQIVRITVLRMRDMWIPLLIIASGALFVYLVHTM